MNRTGPQIKKIREELGLTQEQLTARCNLIGWDITRSTLAKMESQVRRVTDFEVYLIAKALKTDINNLF